MNPILIPNAKPLTRYDIVLDGIIFAADTSRVYPRDGGMYVNIRLSPRMKGWMTRYSMFKKNGDMVWSPHNARKFFIEYDGKVRAVKGKKEVVKWTSDKKAINQDFKPFALALMMRTTPPSDGDTEVI